MRLKRSILLMAVFLLTACASESDGDFSDTRDESAGSDGGSMMMEDSADMDLAEEIGESPESSGERLIGEKVIRTANMDFETVEFTETVSYIRELVTRHDAFIEHSYESSHTPGGGASRQYRMIDYTLRVPTENLTAFLNDLEGVQAQKISEQMGTEDVTQFYRDTEARVQVLENKEERLNELLDQAETIEEIIQIEDSLSQTIAERESLQSQLDYYDDLIDYTSVYLTVTERPRLSGERGDGISFFRRIQDAIVDSFYAFYYILQDLVIFLIYALPFIIVTGLVGWLIWFITKRVKNRKRR
ncbi:DUF4349 domain-containing protein [Alkalibacterium pelagium]|uniref:DUF4349 domain-containing protein n=1 Tax=Alkalibacterium pelagium TaxID=426702 RepID=A0A1H7LBR1_9LACT|nr:DUF4349 domain-containing protein [Alkalibacterium pelagium]GEN50929.1 hypothetical protein APE02nite_15940 [Alkalibacterium pelagium]SEK96384.1 protein of unknown function [Alkalibacterium pelagium]